MKTSHPVCSGAGNLQLVPCCRSCCHMQCLTFCSCACTIRFRLCTWACHHQIAFASRFSLWYCKADVPAAGSLLHHLCQSYYLCNNYAGRFIMQSGLCHALPCVSAPVTGDLLPPPLHELYLSFCAHHCTVWQRLCTWAGAWHCCRSRHTCSWYPAATTS